MATTFVKYPSTPTLSNFKKKYFYLLNAPPADNSSDDKINRPRSRPPSSKLTFFGTVKLHGVNASIVFTPASLSTPQIQSRNQVISPTTTDAFGIRAHLLPAPLHVLVSEIQRIRGVVEDDAFEEILIAGEMAGKGIQKDIGVENLPRLFAIFNIRVDGHWVDLRAFKSVHLPDHRIFNVANFPTFMIEIDFTRGETEEVGKKLEELTDEVVRSCPFTGAFEGATGTGEGIVWTMVEPGPPERDDRVLWNFKTIGEDYAAASSKLSKLAADAQQRAETFVAEAVRERRLEQGVEYLIERGLDCWSLKNVGEFIRWVQDDTIKEESREMERLGAEEKVVRKVISGKARTWFVQTGKRKAMEKQT